MGIGAALATVLVGACCIGGQLIHYQSDYEDRLNAATTEYDTAYAAEMKNAVSLISMHEPYIAATDSMAESINEFADVDVSGKFFRNLMCFGKYEACEDSDLLEYSAMNYILNSLYAINTIEDDNELIQHLESSLEAVEDHIWEIYGWSDMNDSQKERLKNFLQDYVHNLLSDTNPESGLPDPDNLDGVYHSAIEYRVKHGEKYLLTNLLAQAHTNLCAVAMELYSELNFAARESIDEKTEYEQREIEWQQALAAFRPHREAYKQLEFDSMGNLVFQTEMPEVEYWTGAQQIILSITVLATLLGFCLNLTHK